VVTPSAPARIEQCDAWLTQGDVFRSVPIVGLRVISGVARPVVESGPAMLITHSCVMDKPRGKRDLTPRIERLHFLPLTSIASVDEDRQRLLRQQPQKLQPYGACYLGSMGLIGEVFVGLADPVHVPAEFFQVALSPNREDAPSDYHLVAQANDTRFGRPAESIMDLFRAKWIAHWTGQKPSEGGSS